MRSPAVITIGVDPFIHLGGLSIAWHGLTVAIGGLLGGLLAARWIRQSELSTEPLYTIGVLVALGGLIGGRAFFLVEHGGPLIGTNGFTFDGGVILAAALIVLYVWRERLPLAYLDIVAAALPFGVAIGRVGDIINGEHYGPRSTFLLAVRNTNPHALTPDPHLAYQNGGLYEALLALIIFLIAWTLRRGISRPLDMTWLVLALFNLGRFGEFFLRADSPKLALGLDNAQWTSLGLLLVIAVGWPITRQKLKLKHETVA
ncbi:MAG: prolipoprotein diacylglyceryl transferase [Actinomycetota bacterium]|nr:prolipoprotein diacylglyceryl transferase [Actinomycetota bacterium]